MAKALVLGETLASVGVGFRILGPLEVQLDGELVAIGGPRQRALLALLLCNGNRVVSRDRLIDELLGDQPAEAAKRMLHVQVSRLRKALDPDGGGEPRVVARAPGYVLRVEPGELDLERFEELLADGHRAAEAGEFEQASRALREAESLWRGRPLADLEFEPFARTRGRAPGGAAAAGDRGAVRRRAGARTSRQAGRRAGGSVAESRCASGSPAN